MPTNLCARIQKDSSAETERRGERERERLEWNEEREREREDNKAGVREE